MPEGNDPYRYLALRQQIDREARCAISYKKTKDWSFQANPLGAYVVTNPITHVDTVVDVSRQRQQRSSAKQQQQHGGAATAATKRQQQQQQQGDASSDKWETASSASNLSSTSSASCRSSSSLGSSSSRSTTASSAARERQFEDKVNRLERTLDEERTNRLQVQSELQRLQQLLEAHLHNQTAKK